MAIDSLFAMILLLVCFEGAYTIGASGFGGVDEHEITRIVVRRFIIVVVVVAVIVFRMVN